MFIFVISFRSSLENVGVKAAEPETNQKTLNSIILGSGPHVRRLCSKQKWVIISGICIDTVPQTYSFNINNKLCWVSYGIEFGFAVQSVFCSTNQSSAWALRSQTYEVKTSLTQCCTREQPWHVNWVRYKQTAQHLKTNIYTEHTAPYISSDPLGFDGYWKSFQIPTVLVKINKTTCYDSNRIINKLVACICISTTFSWLFWNFLC